MLNNRKILILALLLLGIFPIFAQEGTEEAPPHWTYEEVDEWGELAEDYALCGYGLAQSPIDITGETEIDLSDIGFTYAETALNIINNGHTIQLGAAEGNSILYNGIHYNLLQFHFHHPSEHTVNGVAAPMEVHFVHRDPNSNNLAVVGVLLVEGEANTAYEPIFDNLANATGEGVSIGSLDLNTLLPDEREFVTYNGSLTTPPCSEVVRWLVMEEPVSLSAEQIAAFAAMFEMNARPVQPLNGRDLLGDNG
jgi:carbonic anhydrase